MIETIDKATNATRPATVHEPWYRYGVFCLLLEMAMAVAVSCYSLYMAFHGPGGLPGRH